MKIRILSLMLLGLALQAMPSVAQERKFTREKLNTMLFSTKVDPHWFPTGNDFWFEYKTSEGTSWYVVRRHIVVCSRPRRPPEDSAIRPR